MTELKPYLELPHLLSLTWLAYPVLSLLFVAFRLQLSLSSSEDSISSAKADLLASCLAAERAATSAASMPRYMAIATNKQFADAVNSTINGAREALILALTGMEAVINFIVDIYRSTFLCFLELVVRGGLEILIGAVQELNLLVNSAATSLRTSIQNDIANANKVIQSAIDTINKVNPFTKIPAPQIAVPSLDALQNITLPSSFTDSLVNLNNSIPSVDDLKQKVDDILDKPFELVKADINNTFLGIPTFDASLMPVPSQNTVEFCGQLDTSVVDDLGKELVKTAKIGFIILILMALLLIGLNCLLTWYKWRCLKRHLEFTRQAWTTDPSLFQTKPSSSVPEIALSDHNLMMLQANMHHPFITRIIHTLSGKLNLTPDHYTNIRWFFHYIFHPPALACFLIGFFGLLSVELQLLALGPLDAHFSKQVVAATADFSNTIATAMNTTMYNQSATYAADVNGRVDIIQTTINDGMFGWVNSTTTTLNNTINVFYTDVQNAVSTLLNGTILEQPAQEFIKCFIGSKVDAIEKTLTFLHDNLQVDLPRVNQTILVLSPQSVNEAAQPIAQAAVGSGNNGDGGVVGKIIRTYEAALKKERIMFSIFMGLWGVVILMAILILLWSTYGHQWLEDRRRRKWQREQRSGINGLVVPFREGLAPAMESKNQTGRMSPGSFLSLPPLRTSPFRPFATFNKGTQQRPTHPRFKSDETLVIQSDEDEDDFFGGLKGSAEPRPMTTMEKLKAFGKKAFSRERTQPEVHQADEKKLDQGADVERGRDLAWIGRVRSKLAENLNNSQTHARWPSGTTEKFIIDDEPDVPTPSSAGRLKSRWSNDTTTPVSSNTTPSRRAPPPIPPPVFTSPGQVKSIPSLPPTPRYEEIAPRSSYDQYNRESGSLTKPTVAPVPLHHGFVTATPKASQPQPRPVPQPPIFDWTARSGFPPPPKSNRKPSPRVTTSLLSSAFPDDPISATLDKLRNKSPKRTQRRAEEHKPESSITPVTRLLTTTHARRSSETMNPFVTPFDDEHCVTIETGDPARKSMATNPFLPTGLAL